MTEPTQTARAVWFEAERTAVLRTEEVPAPGPMEIQVRAIHSMVSQGSELNLYRGQGNLPDLLLPTCKGTLPFPVSFAYQTIGEVVAVGPGAGLEIGERVYCPHPHQNLFNIIAPMVNRIPADVDTYRAQFVGLFRVGLQVMLQRAVKPGEVVVVSGLGIVGTFSAYLARLTAGKLIVIDPNAFRRDKAAWLGADAVVAPENAAEVIQRLSNGRGADMYIETSGAPPALQTAIENTAPLGTIAVAAWYGTRPVTLSLSPEFHLRSIKIVSIHVFRFDEDTNWDQDRMFETAFHFLKKIDVQHLITHRIPFDRAPEAYQLLDQHPEQTLAVLLEHH